MKLYFFNELLNQYSGVSWCLIKIDSAARNFKIMDLLKNCLTNAWLFTYFSGCWLSMLKYAQMSSRAVLHMEESIFLSLKMKQKIKRRYFMIGYLNDFNSDIFFFLLLLKFELFLNFSFFSLNSPNNVRIDSKN
jgi:hypothetical protein